MLEAVRYGRGRIHLDKVISRVGLGCRNGVHLSGVIVSTVVERLVHGLEERQ